MPLVASRPSPRLRPHPLRPTRDPRARGGGGGGEWRGDRGWGWREEFLREAVERGATGVRHSARACRPATARGAGQAQVESGFRAAFDLDLWFAPAAQAPVLPHQVESGSIGSAMRSAGPPREQRGLRFHRQRNEGASRASGMAGIEPTPPARKSRGMPA